MLASGSPLKSVTPRHAIGEELQALWFDARRGKPTVAVIQGRAGIGKSHLVGSMVERVRNQQHDVAVGRVHAHGQTGFGPFVNLVTTLAELGRSSFRRHDLVEFEPQGIAHTITEAAHDTPLLVVVEDIHWADLASLSVLHHLVDEVCFSEKRLPLLLLMTERTPGSDGSESIARTVSSSPRGRALRVPRLTSPEVNSMVVEYAGVRPSVRLLGLIDSMTQGTPLDVMTLLHHLEDEGHLLVREERLETRIGPQDLGEDALPSRVIRNQIEELSPDAREQLAVLAILGDAAPVQRLAHVSRYDREAVDATIESAETARLVTRSGESVAFRHATIARAVYLATSKELREDLHARLVDRELTTDTVERAAHAVRAGAAVDDQRSFDLLIAGAEAAVEQTAWSAAVEFLESALLTQAARDLSAAERAQHELTIARCSYRQLDHPEAERYVKRVMTKMDRPEQRGLFAEAAELGVRYRVSREAERAGDPALRGELDAVLANSDATPKRELALVKALQAEIQAVTGEAQNAVVNAEQARVLAFETGDPWAIGRALFASGAAALGAVDLDGASSYFIEAAAAAVTSEDSLVELWSAIRLGLVGMARGDVIGALRDSERAIDRALAIENWAEGSFAAAINTAALAANGRPDGASRREAEARGLYDRANYMATPSFVLEPMSRVRALEGNYRAAHAILDEWTERGRSPTRTLTALVDSISGQPVVDDGVSPEWSPGLDMVGLTESAIVADLLLRLDRPASVYEEILGYIDLVLAVGIRLAPTSGISFLRLRASVLAQLSRFDEAETAFVVAIDEHHKNGAEVEASLCMVGLLELRELQGGAAVADFGAARAKAVAEGLGAVVVQIDRLRQSPSQALRRSSVQPESTSSYRVIMFTDVVGSTSIGIEHGDRAYLSLIRQHDAIVRDALQSHGGFLFDTAGDGMLAWFLEPEQALLAALSVLDGTALAPAVTDNLRLQVRIGIADGTPIELDGDLFGTTLNLASRVVDQALPGQVLCTDSVRAGAAHVDSFEFAAVGTRALKGFADPVLLTRAVHKS